MIRHSLRMSRRIAWWRQRNSLTGSWSNRVLRFSFVPLLLCILLHLLRVSMFRACIGRQLEIFFWKKRYFGTLLQKTSFMLFLNKFDIFEKKVLKVRVNRLVHIYICVDNLYQVWVIDYLHLIGATECVWVVQRLPASFNGKARDWECIRVRIIICL